MGKSFYQNVNGTLVPISYQPFVSMTQAELDAFLQSGKRHPEGTIVNVTDGTSSKFETIQTKVASGVKPMPDGFTSSNSVILASAYIDNNGNLVYGNDNDKIVIYLNSSSGLNVYVNGSSYANKDLFITLMRTDV